MDANSDLIRQDMEETKTHLSEKLESLEFQIAETMQSTGTAVNATVAAMQVTADAVTEVVQDAAHSISNAFDFRRQINRHPWLVFSGAIAFGYLVNELFILKNKSLNQKPLEATQIHPAVTATESEDDLNAATSSVATKAAIAAAYESGRRVSAWSQLRDVAVGAMISVVQEAVSRSVPSVLDYLVGTRTTPTLRPIIEPESVTNDPTTPSHRWSPEVPLIDVQHR